MKVNRLLNTTKILLIFQTALETGRKHTAKCFKEHEQSICHSAALTYQVVVPKCGDAAEMNDNEILNRR